MNMKIPLLFGKDEQDNQFYSDLATMPHLLIAGDTFTGKTTLLHSFIKSILGKFKPNECKLTLIDTQGLSFPIWEDVADFVIGIDDAVSALESVHDEMEQLYLNGKSTNTSYHIVIIDELADLMDVGDDKAVQLINSIAQKGRAVGVHLIAATQRQDYIPDDLLNSIPTRAAFRLPRAVSQRFLGITDAESLISVGEILFSDSGRPPIKIHTPLISSNDIKEFIKLVQK